MASSESDTTPLNPRLNLGTNPDSYVDHATTIFKARILMPVWRRKADSIIIPAENNSSVRLMGIQTIKDAIIQELKDLEQLADDHPDWVRKFDSVREQAQVLEHEYMELAQASLYAHASNKGPGRELLGSWGEKLFIASQALTLEIANYIWDKLKIGEAISPGLTSIRNRRKLKAEFVQEACKVRETWLARLMSTSFSHLGRFSIAPAVLNSSPELAVAKERYLTPQGLGDAPLLFGKAMHLSEVTSRALRQCEVFWAYKSVEEFLHSLEGRSVTKYEPKPREEVNMQLMDLVLRAANIMDEWFWKLNARSETSLHMMMVAVQIVDYDLLLQVLNLNLTALRNSREEYIKLNGEVSKTHFKGLTGFNALEALRQDIQRMVDDLRLHLPQEIEF